MEFLARRLKFIFFGKMDTGDMSYSSFPVEYLVLMGIWLENVYLSS